MSVNTTYTVAFGLFTPDGNVILEDEFSQFLVDEVCPLLESFSVREELGFWCGEPEPCKVLTFITDDDEDALAIWSIATAYKDRFNQEAVLVNSFTSFTDLI